MSAFSHTDWTVICNGTDKDGTACMAEGRTDQMTGAVSATDVRARLKRHGWMVSVPVQDETSRVRRLDFCPEHKTMASYRAGSVTRQRARRFGATGEGRS